MSQLLSFVASVTSRQPLISESLAEPLQLPAFAQGESFEGKITVVKETHDPTNPTESFGFDDVDRVALTDGSLVVYAEGLSPAIANGNEVTFTLLVDSAYLDAAMLLYDDDSIPAFLEVRILKDVDQVFQLLREPVSITRTTPVTVP
jgi:hypothetical protein